MKLEKDKYRLSASDLSNFLNCKHLTELDKKVLRGELKKPEFNNPHASTLQRLGFVHEANYLRYLEGFGLKVTSIPEKDISPEAAYNLTLEAMKRGDDVIAQAVLKHDEWFGKADILRKINCKSNLGEHSYEVMDTKLSKETKAGAILQLSLYSELLKLITGVLPESMYIVSPSGNLKGSPFDEQVHRVGDFQSYYRLVKNFLLETLKKDNPTYPEPVSHCDVCKWFDLCEKNRRDDDHLSFVAGLTSSQRKDLSSIGISTLKELAEARDDFYKKIEFANAESFSRVKEQARMQLEARVSGKPKFELLKIEVESGLARLPEPSPGDIFFDLEGDAFFASTGLEYLWGFSTFVDGNLKYHHKWALDYKSEKECFEWFIDYVTEKKKTYPNLKIYHYSSYEISALKRLMGRYATKESEIDQLLRTGSFIDLYSITRQSIRAGIEKYSIKDLEQFYNYARKANLRDVGPHKRGIEHALELNQIDAVTLESKEVVRAYNQDDTDSTYFLREWLEDLRTKAIDRGEDISRPPELNGEVSVELDEKLQKMNELRASLHEGISSIPEERSEIEKARWLFGDLIGFYRREEKVHFWEKFELKGSDALELMEHKSGISGLTFVDNVGGTARCPIHRYQFIDQVIDIKKDTDVFREGFLRDEKENSFGKIQAVNYEESFVDIKKKTGMADFHPNALWAWSNFPKTNQAERMFELAQFVIDNGLESEDSKYKAARDILLRKDPDLSAPLDLINTDPLEIAKAMALSLNNSYLAIQGPPGTGKSYTASRVVLELTKKGYKVGVTGLSHKVISNLMNKIQEASKEEEIVANLFQKTNPDDENNPAINYIKSEEVEGTLNQDAAFVLGGTDFMWATNFCADKIDYLVVDEAGQFSLVGILSIAHCTKNIILLGDGAQLKQPIQGAHPEGCELSALDYIVGDHKTLPKEKGVFLPTTYRLHPNICKFNSELFYENRLEAINENRCQHVKGSTSFAGKNLAYVEVEHTGNTNHCMEEVNRIVEMVEELVKGENTYTIFKDKKEITQKITYDSIKIISPYNAQVNRIKQVLPNVSVGTVDKFQGQEAPIVIYSVATSSPEDAPRGMEFLYSGNRLNVAVSRAECLFIMVANKRIFEPNCKNPAQMKLANAFCRFLEMV